MERKKETEKKDRKNTRKDTPGTGGNNTENTLTTTDGAEVYTDMIYYFLDEWKESHGIDDLVKCTQSRWNHCLLFLYENIFKDNRRLRNGFRNGYDEKKLLSVCNIYTSLCFLYEKEISIRGFSFLTGVAESVIYAWGNMTNRVTSDCSEIYKKLTATHEETLRNRLYDKGGALGYTVLVNHDCGYNMPGGGSANTPPAENNAAIASKMGLLLSDSSAQENDGGTV